MAVRRQSQGFARGSSSFRGVTHHPNGRWEARIGTPGPPLSPLNPQPYGTPGSPLNRGLTGLACPHAKLGAPAVG
jgi:hypothetical protein